VRVEVWIEMLWTEVRMDSAPVLTLEGGSSVRTTWGNILRVDVMIASVSLFTVYVRLKYQIAKAMSAEQKN
jgi:hypothetical protein